MSRPDGRFGFYGLNAVVVVSYQIVIWNVCPWRSLECFGNCNSIASLLMANSPLLPPLIFFEVGILSNNSFLLKILGIIIISLNHYVFWIYMK